MEAALLKAIVVSEVKHIVGTLLKDELVNLEKDTPIILAAWIAGTDDYPDRVENYQMRVKILEELKQRARSGE